MVSHTKQTQNMGPSDDNELVEFPDPQISPIGNVAEMSQVTLTAVTALLLPAPHSPLENPPLVKKQGSSLL